MSKTLLDRADFVPVTTSEVMNPQDLPFAYRWMQRGFYAVYEGELLANEGRLKASWGLEIDYVNDRSRTGEPSSIGYTLYVDNAGAALKNWLDWPVLFVRFFDIAPLGKEDVDVTSPGLGRISCFKTLHKAKGFTPINKTAWYDEASSLLIKMEVHTLVAVNLYSCVLSEASPFFLRMHESKSSTPPFVSPVIAEPEFSLPATVIDTTGINQEIADEVARRNFVRAAHLATLSGVDIKATRALQRKALQQYIEEFNNFEGANILVQQYGLSKVEVRETANEVLSNREVAMRPVVCFDKGKVVAKTLEDRVRQWLRLF